jgi:hypothetical protein
MQGIRHSHADTLPVAAQFASLFLAAEALLDTALGHRNGPLDCCNDLGDADIASPPGDTVAATGAAEGLEQSAAGQQFQHLARCRHLHARAFRQRVGAQHLTIAGQLHHDQDGVVGQLGYP